METRCSIKRISLNCLRATSQIVCFVSLFTNNHSFNVCSHPHREEEDERWSLMQYRNVPYSTSHCFLELEIVLLLIYIQTVEVRKSRARDLKRRQKRQCPFIFYSQSMLQINLMDQKKYSWFFFTNSMNNC